MDSTANREIGLGVRYGYFNLRYFIESPAFGSPKQAGCGCRLVGSAVGFAVAADFSRETH